MRLPARIFTLLLAVALIALAWWPHTNLQAEVEVDAGLKRALASFAAARTLGGLLAVATSAQVTIPVIGGVSASPAQILKPLQDLTQTFGDVMLAASVAFGVQKLLLAIGGHVFASAALTALAVAWLLLRWHGGVGSTRTAQRLAPVLLAVAVLRFAVPLTALASDGAWRLVMNAPYQAAQAQVESSAVALAPPSAAGAAGASPAPAAPWWDRLLDRARGLALTMPSFDSLRAASEAWVEGMVRLIAVFVVQTVLLPLAMLLTLWRGLRGLLGAAPTAPN